MEREWNSACGMRLYYCTTTTGTVVTTESNQPCHVYTRAYVQCSPLVLSSLCPLSPPLLPAHSYIDVHIRIHIHIHLHLQLSTLYPPPPPPSLESLRFPLVLFFLVNCSSTPVEKYSQSSGSGSGSCYFSSCTIVSCFLLPLVPVTGRIEAQCTNVNARAEAAATHRTKKTDTAIHFGPLILLTRVPVSRHKCIRRSGQHTRHKTQDTRRTRHKAQPVQMRQSSDFPLFSFLFLALVTCTLRGQKTPEELSLSLSLSLYLAQPEPEVSFGPVTITSH